MLIERANSSSKVIAKMRWKEKIKRSMEMMATIRLRIISWVETARMLPKRKLQKSTFMPVVIEAIKVPIARLPAARTAIMASLRNLRFVLSRKMIKEVRITTGRENQRGVKPRAVAIVKAERAVWERPSPSMELFLRTRGTPTRAATVEMIAPARKARVRKS